MVNFVGLCWKVNGQQVVMAGELNSVAGKINQHDVVPLNALYKSLDFGLQTRRVHIQNRGHIEAYVFK